MPYSQEEKVKKRQNHLKMTEFIFKLFASFFFSIYLFLIGGNTLPLEGRYELGRNTEYSGVLKIGFVFSLHIVLFYPLNLYT